MKSRTRNFKEVIDVLVSSEIDWKQLVVDIAKDHPASVVVAAGKQIKIFGWKEECRALVWNGQKIEAIKACRAATGMSLKESKDAVEAL